MSGQAEKSACLSVSALESAHQEAIDIMNGGRILSVMRWARLPKLGGGYSRKSTAVRRYTKK